MGVDRHALAGMIAAALLAGAAAAPRPAQAMDFRLVPPTTSCPIACLFGQGAIDADTLLDFDEALKRENLPSGATVALDSLGGRFLVGVALGESIRKHGLSTLVGRYDAQASRFGPASCASACVYVFMGGATRTIVSGSRFGVHQVRLDRKELSARDAQLMMGLAGDLVGKSGATVELLVLALATPPEDIRWLSRGELIAIKVVTDSPAPGPDDKAAQSLETSALIRFRLLGANIRDGDGPQASQIGDGQ